MSRFDELRKIRCLLAIFMAALVISGATAFAIETELTTLCSVFGIDSDAENTSIAHFLQSTKESFTEMNQKAPQIAYGYDWLAFAHIVIALLFIGPYRDPIGNKWVIQWGLIACAAILPLALICGIIRQIPPYWRLIDCSFGIIGAIPLLLCLKYIKALENRHKGNE
ncbi:MAG: hypothetical protein J6Y82_00620 [Bacteroidales bacterium]|nr:hypothetical protein [Bacteroidales bacterium]